MTEDQHNKAIVIRSEVEAKNDYHDYLKWLRFDFWYACAYCTLCESEPSGIGFEIDHYLPTSRHPELINDYCNLMWSCKHCNQHKSAFSPNKSQIEQGHVILRPDKDNPNEHLEIDGYDLKAKTITGEFNIIILNLNRQPLQRLRKIRERFYNAAGYIAYGVHHLISLKLDLISNPQRRLILSDIKGKVAEKYGELAGTAEQLIRDFAKSPMLDPDPEKKERSKKRKQYLKEQKVIGLGLGFKTKKPER
jgi:hypothetical protein